jgi:hypothetical protein
MKKPLIALFALVLSLPLACSSDPEEPPNPLATRDGFCQAWAESACTAKVVDYCTTQVSACQATQKDVCLDLVPRSYSSVHAEGCLRAVGGAYEDGDLSAEELGVVLHLASPCDKLSSGASGDGDSCTENNDCNTVDGFVCVIKKGAATGVCAEPEVVGAAEECTGKKQICAEGYYCNDNCVVYKKTDTGVCEGDYQCKPEDHCVEDADDPETSHCVARSGTGEACTADSDCASGICLPETDTESVCVSTIRLSRNEPLCENLK